MGAKKSGAEKLIAIGSKEVGKGLAKGKKFIDDLFTPKSVVVKQKAQTKALNKKIKEKKDPLKAFADSKDKTIKKTRKEAAEKAKAAADKKKADLKKRQAKERKAAIAKNKKIAGGVTGTTILAGGTAAALSGDDKPKSKTMKTTSQMKKDAKDVSSIADFSSKVKKAIPPHKPPHERGKSEIDIPKPRIPKRPKVTGKGGRNVSTGTEETGKRTLANVTREQLKDSGMNLNQYLNFMDRNEGKRPPKVAKKNMGGMMRKASVPGYKDGKEVKKQGYNARLDESLGSRNGSKTQSMKARRDESKGMEKSMGRRAYSGNKSSGQTKSTKPSRPQSAGVAKRGWGAAIR